MEGVEVCVLGLSNIIPFQKICDFIYQKLNLNTINYLAGLSYFIST
jgi:hypothetical protein